MLLFLQKPSSANTAAEGKTRRFAHAGRAIAQPLNTDINIMLYDRMQKRVTVPVSMAPEVVKQIDGARAKLGYRSRNEVVRESIRHFLEEIEEMKVIRIRDISLKQAKKEILAYLKQHNSAYVSDIADTLGIDIRVAFKVVEELQREGVVG